MIPQRSVTAVVRIVEILIFIPRVIFLIYSFLVQANNKSPTQFAEVISDLYRYYTRRRRYDRSFPQKSTLLMVDNWLAVKYPSLPPPVSSFSLFA